jgi:hypothetical protein
VAQDGTWPPAVQVPIRIFAPHELPSESRREESPSVPARWPPTRGRLAPRMAAGRVRHAPGRRAAADQPPAGGLARRHRPDGASRPSGGAAGAIVYRPQRRVAGIADVGPRPENKLARAAARAAP